MLDPSTQNTLGYSWCAGVGVATLANALFNCFIICSHPGFQKANGALAEEGAGGASSGGAAGGDPSKLTDEQVRAYLEAHPELAAAALASVSEQRAQPADLEAGHGGRAAAGKPGAKAAAAPAAAEGKYGGFSSDSSYKPPALAGSFAIADELSPAAVTVSAPAHDLGSKANPFPMGAAAPAPAARAVHAAAPAAASRAAPAAPAAAAAGAEEDNPFASDNPFEH